MAEFKSFFKKVAGNEGDRCHYSTRLDTYGCGCQHNCGFCYARSLLDFRKLWNPAFPSIANINKIRHTVRTKLKPGEIVRLGGMTDYCAFDMLQEGFIQSAVDGDKHNVLYDAKVIRELYYMMNR